MGEAEDKIRERIGELQRELEERKRSLPAHSIRPHQLLILEALEEEIAELKARLEG